MGNTLKYSIGNGKKVHRIEYRIYGENRYIPIEYSHRLVYGKWSTGPINCGLMMLLKESIKRVLDYIIYWAQMAFSMACITLHYSVLSCPVLSCLVLSCTAVILRSLYVIYSDWLVCCYHTLCIYRQGNGPHWVAQRARKSREHCPGLQVHCSAVQNNACTLILAAR